LVRPDIDSQLYLRAPKRRRMKEIMLRRLAGGAAVIPLIVIFVMMIAWVVLFCRAIYRTRMGRTCWYCGAAKVRASATKHTVDAVARLSLLFPYRCSRCLKRFYRFRLPAWRREDASGAGGS
jgi:hypothetical protein